MESQTFSPAICPMTRHGFVGLEGGAQVLGAFQEWREHCRRHAHRLAQAPQNAVYDLTCSRV